MKYLLSNEDKSLRLARWMDRLALFDFEIIYKKGVNNLNADAFSRIATDEIEADQIQNRENETVVVNAIQLNCDHFN